MTRTPLALALPALLVAVGAQARETEDGPPAACPGPSAPIVRVERAPDGRGVQVDIDMLVDAPLATIERMVRDVERWPDWIPNMKQVAIDESDADDPKRIPPFATLVDLPWPLHDVSATLLLSRAPTDDGGVRIAWAQTRGDLRRNEGSWTLYARGDQAARVVYRANFQLGFWLPPFLVRRAGEQSAPKFIENMRRRAAIMAGPHVGTAAAPHAG